MEMDGEVERDDSADQEEVMGRVNKKKRRRGREPESDSTHSLS